MRFLKATHAPADGPKPKHIQVALSRFMGMKNNNYMNLVGKVGRKVMVNYSKKGEGGFDHNTLQACMKFTNKNIFKFQIGKRTSHWTSICAFSLLSKCIDYHLHDKEKSPMQQIR